MSLEIFCSSWHWQVVWQFYLHIYSIPFFIHIIPISTFHPSSYIIGPNEVCSIFHKESSKFLLQSCPSSNSGLHPAGPVTANEMWMSIGKSVFIVNCNAAALLKYQLLIYHSSTQCPAHQVHFLAVPQWSSQCRHRNTTTATYCIADAVWM